ncbi:MAG: hypothetical protein JJ974_04630 [Phycisphaerales bacterium]|nr:hypothetical protein [Phycisphaerales bacterium]
MSDSQEPNPIFEHSIYWVRLNDSQILQSETLHTGETPIWLEIEKQDSGYFLHTLAEDRKSGSDTWHQSLDDAFHQAEYSCGIRRDEWKQFHT